MTDHGPASAATARPGAGFDPRAPGSARWRAWLAASLAGHGVPSDATLEVAVQPLGAVPAVRLSLDARWVVGDGPDGRQARHARGEALVATRRLCGTGWPGWPAYLASIRLLRALG